MRKNILVPTQLATMVMLSLWTRDLMAADYGQLPAAPHAANSMSTSYILYLTLVVNGRSDDRLTQVEVHGSQYLVPADALQRMYVRANSASGKVDVITLPQVTTHYDSGQQRLVMTVPENWLPIQMVGKQSLIGYQQAESGNGLLLGYDSYSLHTRGGQSTTNTWLEQRLFSSAGSLSNTGTWRNNWSKNSETNIREGYLRYDTNWKYNDEKNMIAWQVGDVINNSLTWSNSTRIGGLRIARNFSVRPDLITYPLMNLSGTAAVPGSVDLFINGSKASSNELNAGPFTLTSVPYINGAGEATVVTTDALGRRVSTSIPFYVSNQLLQKGLSDFDFTTGAIRRNYGSSSADYGEGVASGIWRYGLNDKLTLSAHGEGARGLGLAGIGSDMVVGRWGTLSVAWSQSQANNNGSQLVTGYSYNTNLFSIALQHQQRTDGYSDISTLGTSVQLSRQSDQATLSLIVPGEGNGTLGLGYFDVQARDNSHTRLANVSWSRSLWGDTSLYVALNKTLGESGYSGLMQINIPLGQDRNATVGLQRNNRGNYVERVTMSQSTPLAGGLGWNLAYDHGNTDYHQADIGWKSPYATLSGGVFGEGSNNSQWADLSGSIIYMDNALFASNKIYDSFILVSTSGYPDIPVNFENQLAGKTDSRGHLLIPSVTSWYPAKLGIDPLNLPLDISTPTVDKTVSVREASGTLVEFPVKRVRSVTLTLQDQNHQPLPVGTLVTETHSGQTAVVGYDGKTWFSQLGTDNEIVVQLPQGNCHHSFTLPEHNSQQNMLAPFICSLPATQETHL
ncbi:fimbria/pilus outer membrane usher protein [Erwinia piriflorinigrans]|uniref:Outer membrane usher protein fimD n=1 Tax=Erwinia piriflorinigrans CFBP 5888 TaxID=1161919 RepID=V5ZAK8_9GAMM|nr:fimbria/pilus outer membrane usher protein [Erwinia piriflorinigrans]CCG87960.1 Outer membrane usher protein fimD [Erwinia piriflorinigrans CFBP 5888]